MSQKLIQVFAKNPTPGNVKTRLIAKLGAKGACAVYQQVLGKTILNANSDNIETEIWLDTIEHKNISNIIKINKSMQIYEQKGNNIGDKMYYALSNGLLRADKIVLVGSDCPQISQKHYVKLFETLENHDLALIPVVDGGYVAIGARKIDKSIFSGIAWSTNSVYTETIKRIKLAGLSYQSLTPLRDLDLPEDYEWHLQQKNIQ